MSKEQYEVDASDPGKAAQVLWAASVLACKVAGMVAENMQRQACGNSMAYTFDSFEYELDDARSTLAAKLDEVKP